MKPHSLTDTVLQIPSPYPASFDGSTWRYQLALFALMSVSIMSLKLFTWMVDQTWKGRHDAYPFEPLFAVRMIVLFASLAAFLRCAPEAAMMITWRENAAAAASILVAKRWLDAFTFFPSFVWMALVSVFYPRICMGLVRIAHEDCPAGIECQPPKIPRERLQRLATMLALTFTISILIAVGKRW